MLKTYKTTMRACFTGYIVQAIINNFAPLLFVTWNMDFDIPVAKITLLITLNFLTQLAVDVFGAAFADRLGYRLCIVLAHVFSASGLILMGFLPFALSPYAGILISVIVCAVGSGLIEVLVSPIMEGCPNENKAGAMSLLHSFYCWGQMGVVLLSTLFFIAFGRDSWRTLSLLWAAIPLFNLFVFSKAPLPSLLPEGDRGMTFRELFKNRYFILFCVMMVSAGAGELSVSQWASAFAEKGLLISKTAGDLLGPMLFSLLMGFARVFFGKKGAKIKLEKFMTGSAALCVVSYLMASLSPWPVLSLLGSALTGLGVGIMWPGTFSLASKKLPRGSTKMFALLALAGDLGCSAGPTAVGFITDLSAGDMKKGILFGTLFPVVMLLSALRLIYNKNDASSEIS
ncbi:MAG: MFS transporter [Clostridia bacterium]|nr:MFS transporter [Clostridia bacterium]